MGRYARLQSITDFAVSYQYRNKDNQGEAKDVTQLAMISTAAVNAGGYNTSASTETYDYDPDGRLLKKTLKINNRLGYPFETDYAYDNLGRITDVIYPWVVDFIGCGAAVLTAVATV